MVGSRRAYAVFSEFRKVLQRHDFNRENIARFSGGKLWSDRAPSEAPGLALLIDLFIKGSPVKAAELADKIKPLSVDDLAAVRLVKLVGDYVRPFCHIEPYQQLFVSSELRPIRSGCVLGVNNAAETLAHLTIRHPVALALDMGTGCGVQALLAARHAGAVIATDVNPRALAFTAQNARLNGLSNIDCRCGSWFEPVRDEMFDLVVCNPPFVISPDSSFLFRDGGLPADGVCEKVAGELPQHLKKGGRGLMLVNWVHDGSWAEPLHEWVEESGSDVFLIHYATMDCAEYAALWNHELCAKSPRRFEQTVNRWIDYYRESGIRRIASGAIAFRRRSDGCARIRAVRATHEPGVAAGEHLERLFAGADFLESVETDRSLLEEVFTLIEGHHIEQTIRREAGQYVAEAATFRIASGIGLEASVDPRVLELLLNFDGRPLGKLIREIARCRGLEEAGLADVAVSAVRRLIELGFVVPLYRKNGRKNSVEPYDERRIDHE